MKFFIFAQSGSISGMGHFSRMEGLAQVLRPLGEVHLITERHPLTENHKPNSSYKIHLTNRSDLFDPKKFADSSAVAILDGYGFIRPVQVEFSKIFRKTLCIADFDNREFAVDAILNHGGYPPESVPSVHDGPRLFLGPQFAMLREAFYEEIQSAPRTEVTDWNFFLSFGSLDDQNFSAPMVARLSELPKANNVTVLLSSLSPFARDLQILSEKNSKLQLLLDPTQAQLLQIMKKSRFFITSASTVALESCAIGGILLTGCMADNQRGIYHTLVQENAAAGMGDWLNADLTALEGQLSHLNWNKFVSAQKKIFRGSPPDNIREALREWLSNA